MLSIDLDGNDRVSDEERAALANIDALTEYINNTAKPSAAVGEVVITSDNQKVRDFVTWIQTKGQEIVTRQGFLKVHGAMTALR